MILETCFSMTAKNLFPPENSFVMKTHGGTKYFNKISTVLILNLESNVQIQL